MNLEQAKQNRIQWCLMTDEERRPFLEVGKRNCKYRGPFDNHWSPACKSSRWCDEQVYQIYADYEPEPDTERCAVKPASASNRRLGYERNGGWFFLEEALADPDFITPLDAEGNRMGSLRLVRLSRNNPADAPKTLLFRRSQ